MAPTLDDGGGEAAGEPPIDAPSRSGLDFLRGLHQNPPPVCTAGPSSYRSEKSLPSRPAVSFAVELDSAPAIVILTEVDESSSAASKKKRGFAQAYLPFGTPPANPTPPPAPVQAPSLVSRELTRAEKAEEKFWKAQQLYVTQWLPKFEWLLLDKIEEGLPILRYSICVEHGKDDAKFGRNGTGGRDLQLGSMQCHELSVCHDNAMKRLRTLMAKIEKQKRIDDFANADKEGARLTRLMRSVDLLLLFPPRLSFASPSALPPFRRSALPPSRPSAHSYLTPSPPALPPDLRVRAEQGRRAGETEQRSAAGEEESRNELRPMSVAPMPVAALAAGRRVLVGGRGGVAAGSGKGGGEGLAAGRGKGGGEGLAAGRGKGEVGGLAAGRLVVVLLVVSKEDSISEHRVSTHTPRRFGAGGAPHSDTHILSLFSLVPSSPSHSFPSCPPPSLPLSLSPSLPLSLSPSLPLSLSPSLHLSLSPSAMGISGDKPSVGVCVFSISNV
ncbi:unnamed protein product [Closterium sp. NIES-54]